VTDVEIANVTGWISYRQEFDLGAFAEAFSQRNEITEVTYDPSKNSWLQTYFAPDRTYVAFYRSGRCSITSVKSVEEFQTTVNRVNTVMRELLDFDYEPNSEVTNIVVTTELESTILLEALAVELGLESVEYEPEQFPGLIYRGQDHVILMFVSGKMVCTGLDNLNDIVSAIEELRKHTQKVV